MTTKDAIKMLTQSELWDIEDQDFEDMIEIGDIIKRVCAERKNKGNVRGT
jgi:hypothetical protein